MAIIDSINNARQQGATDDQIVAEIAKQNPQKAASFQSATQAGADSTTILNEILKQNAVVSPSTPMSVTGEAIGNVAGTFVGGLKKIGTSLAGGAGRAISALGQGDILGAGRAAGEAALGTFAGGVQAFYSPEIGLAMTAAKEIDKATGGAISGQLKQLAQDNPQAVLKVQDLINKHPQATTDVADLLSIVGIKGVAPAIRIAGKEVASTAAQGVRMAAETPVGQAVTSFAKENIVAPTKELVSSQIIKPITDKLGSTFEENLNKALPVLKKDVKTLPIKQVDAKTAFTDIVQNKDSIGITDNAGNIKSPSQYDFNDTVKAQANRLKQIYSDYTAKLSTVDKPKFDADIHEQIFKQIDSINAQLAKENTIAGRNALIKIKTELGGLRDTSPEGIQSYIEAIGQQTKVAPGHPFSPEQVKMINLAGNMRKILDTSVENLNGTGYQDLRNVYKAHKTIESQLIQAAKSELNKTPGWTDRMANLGMTGEGINFLMTHDPHALIVGAGIKGSTMFTKWLNSPQRALSNMFKEIENAQKPPLSPSRINQSANSVPSSSNIPINVSQFSPEVQRILKMQGKLPETSVTTGSQKTIDAFSKSIGQTKIGNFELGSFGKNSANAKIGKEDRFPISQLENTTKYIKQVYKASNNPTSYRNNNIVWIAKMPNGENRAIYTRLNSSGKEEIINWHTISNPKYIEDLKKFGIPDQSRTGAVSLEGSRSIH